MIFGILYVCAISVILFFMYMAVWPFAKKFIIGTGAVTYVACAIALNNPVTAILPALIAPFCLAVVGIVFLGWKDTLQGKPVKGWGQNIDGGNDLDGIS